MTNKRLEDALDAALGTPRSPYFGSSHVAAVEAAPRGYQAKRTGGGSHARMTPDAVSRMKAGDRSQHVFQYNPDTELWDHVSDEDHAADISDPARAKFYLLTSDDLRGLLKRPVSKPLLLDESEKRTISVYLHIRASVMENPNLSDREKTSIMHKVRRGALLNKNDARHETADVIEYRLDANQAQQELVESFHDRPLVLQRPTGSVFHKAREAFASNTILFPFGKARERIGEEIYKGSSNGLAGEHHIFLIEHNWAGAFSNATDFDGGELRLPFPLTAYEFQINNHRIVVSIAEGNPSNFGYDTALVVIQTKFGWMLPMAYEFHPDHFRVPDRAARGLAKLKNLADASADLTDILEPLMALIHSQIRATLISLDAEVATTEIIRAPHRLNAKRERDGRIPLFDYHIVSLARRARPEPLPRDPNQEPRRSPRCHFRRGHWRHYENHKAWIKWMMIGDPDLGFIDKHYRL